MFLLRLWIEKNIATYATKTQKGFNINQQSDKALLCWNWISKGKINFYQFHERIARAGFTNTVFEKNGKEHWRDGPDLSHGVNLEY